VEARERETGGGVSVWYDGACPLCAREVAILRRLDREGAISFKDVSQAVDDSALPKPREALLARFHAAQGGQLQDGAGAFALVWRTLPPLRALGRLARQRPVLWLLERAYCAFLRVRPALQAAVRRFERGGSRP